MTHEQQLKLQAFLDGELPEREAREILAWTQRDGAAAALLAELKNTRAAMAKSEPHLSVPESREFFWSKIEREIQRLEPRGGVRAGSFHFCRAAPLAVARSSGGRAGYRRDDCAFQRSKSRRGNGSRRRHADRGNDAGQFRRDDLS